MAEIAYFPVVSIVSEDDQEPTCDKFGGRPLLDNNTPWPTCQHCNDASNLVFLCQLTVPIVEQLPYQIFACPDCSIPLINRLNYDADNMALRLTPESHTDSDATDWYELPCFRVNGWEQHAAQKKGVKFIDSVDESRLILCRTFYMNYNWNDDAIYIN